MRRLRLVVAHPVLRRVLMAEAAVGSGTGIMLVALTVFAFEVGGAPLLGLALAARHLGVGLMRPLVGVAIDRLSPRTGVRTGASIAVLGETTCVVGGAIGATAGVTLVIVGMCVLKLGHSIAKAGRRAAIANAAESPDQAAATVALLSTATSCSGLVGPFLASVTLLVSGLVGAMLVGAGLYLFVAVQMWCLPLSTTPTVAGGSVAQVISGQRETLRAPFVILTFVLVGTGSFLGGSLAVYYAPLAIDALGIGDAGVGVLRMGFGVGGVIGSIALLRAGRAGGGSSGLAFGVVLFGAAIAVVSLTGELWVALVPMLAVGGARTQIDAAYLTLLQRRLPESLHARVLGLGETVTFVGGGVGSLLAAPLIGTLGLTAAMAVTGTVAAATALVVGSRLRRVDDDAPAPLDLVELLQETSTLALLPPIEIDLLALRLGTRALLPGELLMRQGATGDSWFVVGDGELDVTVDGRDVSSMTRGDGLGEIALLRDCPRTATVTARTPCVVHELRRTTFLRAVGLGDGDGFDQLIAERLGDEGVPAGRVDTVRIADRTRSVSPGRPR